MNFEEWCEDYGGEYHEAPGEKCEFDQATFIEMEPEGPKVIAEQDGYRETFYGDGYDISPTGVFTLSGNGDPSFEARENVSGTTLTLTDPPSK